MTGIKSSCFHASSAAFVLLRVRILKFCWLTKMIYELLTLLTYFYHDPVGLFMYASKCKQTRRGTMGWCREGLTQAPVSNLSLIVMATLLRKGC